MHEFLMSLLPWGTELIIRVQEFRTPLLDGFFKALTFLGEEEFYLLVMFVLYWIVNKPLGVRLTFLLLPGAYLNSCLKALFYTPRPDPAHVARLVEETSYAFPSGHAQNSAALLGFVMLWARRGFVWLLGLLLLAGIAFSRIYLGVHYPQDVIGGFLFGVVYLLLFLWLEKPVGAWLGRQTLPVRLGLAVLLPIGLVLLNPTEGATTPAAMMTGFGVGHTLQERWLRFETGGLWWKRVLRFLVGLVLVMSVYLGFKAILPAGLLFRFVRYVCVGLMIALGAPWVFLKTGLAASSKAEGAEAVA